MKNVKILTEKEESVVREYARKILDECLHLECLAIDRPVIVEPPFGLSDSEFQKYLDEEGSKHFQEISEEGD